MEIKISKNFFFYLLLAFIMYVVYKSRQLLLPFSLSLLLIYLILPLVNFLENGHLGKIRISLPRGIAILITYFIYGIFFAVFLIYLTQPVVKQFNDFSKNFKVYINKTQKSVKKIQSYYLKFNFPTRWNNLVSKELENIFSLVINKIKDNSLHFFKFFSHLIELFFIPIIAFYVILDREILQANLLNLFGKQRELVREILLEINEVNKKYIQGQVILSFIMGVIATVLFSLLGIEFALLAGIFAGITKFIPMVGPVIGWIPVFILAMLKSFKAAIWVTIFFTFAHFLENKLILPKLMQYYVNLHPVTIIIALLVGAQLGSILGMFIAVPVMASLKVLFFKLKPILLNEKIFKIKF